MHFQFEKIAKVLNAPVFNLKFNQDKQFLHYIELKFGIRTNQGAILEFSPIFAIYLYV